MYTLAIFGGTFNPFHKGHMQMLNAVAELDYVEKILIMPSKIPPHKDADFLADEKHRITMCQIAAENIPKAEVTDVELKREGKSYTIDTLLELSKIYPNYKLAITVGGDMITSFNTWKRYKDVLEIADIIAFKRADIDNDEFYRSVSSLINDGGRITVMKEEIINISSTELRHSICDKPLLEKYLSKDIIDYILENDVYNTGFSYFKSVIREKLDDYRFHHSLCVADEAKRLAELYGADENKAYLAGLLHDITKNYSDEEHLKILGEFDIILSAIEKNAAKLWHAISGEAYLRGKYGIKDPDILNSVRYHTTARVDMSLLEKIIYVADFTSRDRDYPDVNKMRELSNVSLEVAMEYALKYTITDLESKNQRVHTDTLNAYNQLINNKKED